MDQTMDWNFAGVGKTRVGFGVARRRTGHHLPPAISSEAAANSQFACLIGTWGSTRGAASRDLPQY